MTTARQYNEAVDEQAHLRKRFVELTEQNIGLEQRVEELLAAVEDVNRAGVLRIRELEARNAKLEAVAKIASMVIFKVLDLSNALDALAATDAKHHCCEPCNEGGPDYP